jgi:hypothetical protein
VPQSANWRGTPDRIAAYNAWLPSSVSVAALLMILLAPTLAFGHSLRRSTSAHSDAFAYRPTLEELNGTGSSITVGLKVTHSGTEQPTMVVRGHRATPSPLGKFNVSASLPHVPCSGEYRFEAAQENTENGNSIAYGAQITLFDGETQPPGAGCGTVPLSRRGTVKVTLETPNKKPFILHVTRNAGGPFRGTLHFTKFLECDQTYRLETDFHLTGLDRTYSFGVLVNEIDISVPGKKPVSSPC